MTTDTVTVYGTAGGFSLWIDTPYGEHIISAYGKLRVEVDEGSSITIMKDSNYHSSREFFLSIVWMEEEETLDILLQTGGISQTKLKYPRITYKKWQEIVTAAEKAEKESGREEDQQDYESE